MKINGATMSDYKGNMLKSNGFSQHLKPLKYEKSLIISGYQGGGAIGIIS